MNTIFNRPNTEKTAIINPQDTVKPIAGFPERCVSTFSQAIIEKYAAMPGVKQIAELYTANSINPVYKCDYKGHEIAFYMSLVGAPACVSCFEEVAAMGAGRFILFGSCGILDDTVKDKIIIPTSAVRDEGTSYHYIPAGEEVVIGKPGYEALASGLTNLGVDFVEGKTWTTDGIYRETKALLGERQAQGCIAVEMEFSAMAAAAQFRSIPFGQFLYGADCLAYDTWEPRDLADHGLSKAEKLMTIAFECAIKL